MMYIVNTIKQLMVTAIGFLVGLVVGIIIGSTGLLVLFSELPFWITLLLSFMFAGGIMSVIVFSKREKRIEQINSHK